MTYRFYFNRHAEAPQVWSVDEGDQTTEVNVKQVVCYVKATSHYNGTKVNPDSPSAWFEVENARLSIIGGVAHIHADDLP